jgi:hypothetical protein
MPTLLVCTVGGSESPIAFRIATPPHPDRVIFVCSADSLAKVPDILARAATRGVALPVGCYDAWEIGNHEDNRRLQSHVGRPDHGRSCPHYPARGCRV